MLNFGLGHTESSSKMGRIEILTFSGDRSWNWTAKVNNIWVPLSLCAIDELSWANCIYIWHFAIKENIKDNITAQFTWVSSPPHHHQDSMAMLVYNIIGRLAHILCQRGSPTLKNLCIFYLTSVQNLAGSLKVCKPMGKILKIIFHTQILGVVKIR